MAATPARDRLLAAANDLFYREGVHTVGIDRVIAEAGVAKASLYNTFGSKDELIRAYLEARHAAIVERMGRALAAYDDAARQAARHLRATRPTSTAGPTTAAARSSPPAPRRSPAARRLEATAAYRAWLRAVHPSWPRRPARPTRRPGRPAPSALRRRRHLGPHRPRPRRLGGRPSRGGRPSDSAVPATT